MANQTAILGLFAGQVKTHWPGKKPSAINKTATLEPTLLTKYGLETDDQADKSAHGGEEKALHHYPSDHYVRWQKELGANLRFAPGGFGENIATVGLLEENVCIGDTFQLGKATVQISQGRQPCWKLSEHTAIPQMAYLVRKTLRTGWYYRVLEEGTVQPGDQLALISRPNPEWSVHRVTSSFFKAECDPEICAAMAKIEELFVGWRKEFAARKDRAS